MAYQTGPSSQFEYRSRPDSDYLNVGFQDNPRYPGGWGQSSQKMNRNYMHQKVNNQYRFHRNEEELNDQRSHSYQTSSFGSVQNQSYYRGEQYWDGGREQSDRRIFERMPPNIEDQCTIPEEELESLFNGMVIFCFLSENYVFLKKGQIIKDSFLRSGIPGELKFDFDCHPERTDLLCCTVVWQDRKLAHGSGTSRLVAKKRAASYLIDALSETCFTVKAKPEYYNIDSYRKRLFKREVAGVFRIVSKRDAPDMQRAFQFIDDFFIEDTDCELVFGIFEGFSEFELIKRHAKFRGLEYLLLPLSHVSVFKRRSAQYWRDKLLNSNNMENEKFIMEPPRRARMSLPESIRNESLLSKEGGKVEIPKPNRETAKEKRKLRKNKRKQKSKYFKSLPIAAEGKDPTLNEPTQHIPLEKTTQQPNERLISFRRKNCLPLMTKQGPRARLNMVEEEIKRGKPITEIRDFEFLSAKHKASCIILERAWAKYYANLKTSQSQSTYDTNS